MKKILVFLLALLMIFVVGCAEKTASETYRDDTDEENVTYETNNPESCTKHYDNVYIDIGVGEDGLYGLSGGIDCEYFDGELVQVYMNNPALLFFCVSSNFDNGVYLLKLTDGDKIIETLSSVRDALIESGKAELAEKIQEVIDTMNTAGPIISAST